MKLKDHPKFLQEKKLREDESIKYRRICSKLDERWHRWLGLYVYKDLQATYPMPLLTI